VGFRAERGESRCCALTKVTEVASLIVHNEIDKTGTLFGAYCWVSRVERKTLINMQRGDFQHAGMMSRARVQQSPKYNSSTVDGSFLRPNAYFYRNGRPGKQSW